MRRPLLVLFSIFMGVLLFHAFFLSQSFYKNLLESDKSAELSLKEAPLKISSFRTLGVEESKKDHFFLSGKEKPSDNAQKVKKQKGDPLQKLNLADLNISPKTNVTPNKVVKAIDNLQIEGKGIKEFLKKPTTDMTARNTGQRTSPGERFGQRVNETTLGADASLNNSDVAVNLELPKGVKLDELNKEELMFYSFQKRSALQYVSTFYNKLQEFERQNPHLNFPMTKEKTRMTGRITYDKEGNIMRIKMLEWTKTQRLQDFFVEVLKDMNGLPNPPRLLIDENDEFSIVYSLIINV